MLDRAALIAFDHPSLAEARRLEPRVTCGVLYACRPLDAPALAHAVGAEALLPEWSFVVAEDVARAHAAGLVVQPWESSDAQVIASLLAAGVDGVASDRPDVARAVLGAATPRAS
jgi:glycerophosphoryl diester phosphodiesterase